MNTDHWILTYQVPSDEFGWAMPQFEQLKVPVTLTPADAVEIERVFHRLTLHAIALDAHSRRLRDQLIALQRRSVWAVLRDALTH